jgi:hypothetical protein
MLPHRFRKATARPPSDAPTRDAGDPRTRHLSIPPYGRILHENAGVVEGGTCPVVVLGGGDVAEPSGLIGACQIPLQPLRTPYYEVLAPLAGMTQLQ